MCQMCTIGKEKKNLAEEEAEDPSSRTERKNDPSLITTSTTHTTTQ